MSTFNILTVCGPYGVKYAWAPSEEFDYEKPCAWIHDLTAGSIIKADQDVSFTVTVEDLSSAITLRSTALRLLNLLSKPARIFGTENDSPDPSRSSEDSAGETEDVKPLLIIAQGLSGVVVKQAILIGLKKQKYHSVVRRICRLVFFGCPHRFPLVIAEWERLCVDIPSLYSNSDKMVGPMFLKSCTIGGAAMTALSAEFAMIATAYDIVNIYEGNDGTSSKIIVGEESGTLGINSEVSIASPNRYLSLSHHRPSCKIFSAIQEAIQKYTTFQNRTEPDFVSTFQVLVRLGGLLHAPERDLLARAQGAFTWMTYDSRYEDWLSDEGVRILHLYGSTGCGKSNMLGYLASALCAKKFTNQPIVFKFCFNKAHQARATFRGFLLDFILQWLFCLPGLYRNVTFPPSTSEEVQLWKTQTLWEIFHQMLLEQSRPRIFCLIDDLEACQPQLKRFIPSIFAAIDEHQAAQPETPIPAFKLLITSNACSPQLGLTHFHKCINLEREGGLMDDRDGIIDAGVTQLIQKRPVLIHYRERLMQRLRASKNITILQVNLHFAILEQCIIDSTPKCIGEELKVIPHGLGDCYGTILESVRGRRLSLASGAFSWIFHTIRTLHTEELATALAINPDTGEFDEDDISGDIVSDLGNVVGPLITVIGDQIDFSHWSFREYISTRWKDKATWEYTQFGHDAAALCCLSYLRTMLRKLKDSGEGQVHPAAGGISWISESRSDGLRFLNYAVTNWAYHYLKFMSPVSGQLETPARRTRSEKCITKLRDFLEDREVFDLWFQLYCGLQNQTIAQYQPGKAEERTWLMFLAESGLLNIRHMLCQHGHDFNRLQEENAGASNPKQAALALSLSAHQGHCAAVKRLLSGGYVENDAVMDITKDIARRRDVDEIFPAFLKHVLDKGLVDAKSWCSLLCATIENGHGEAFQLLINSIDKFDLADSWEEDLKPFHLAAAFGDEDLLKKLITDQYKLKLSSPAGQLNPGEPEAGTNGPSTPFHVAARNGHLNIIQLLHPEHASLEGTNSDTFTPLHLACMTGHPEVVKFLIEAGANVNAGLEDSRNPLFYASGNGRREVVRILLDHNSKLKDFQSLRQTPLHWAARGGFSECARLLLDRGADKNCLDYSDSPLVYAIRSKNLQVVKLLIDYGVDLDHTTGYPLYIAIDGNNLEAVEKLLHAGAGTGHVGHYSYSGIALHYACRNQNVPLVKLLLSKATPGDLNKEDSSHDTPITEALRLRGSNMQTCAEIVNLILDAGADVNAPGGNEERPLERAYDSYAITKVLLEHSPRLDFEPSEWGLDPGGPLWPAVRNGEHEVVSALLTAGARIHDTDDYGKTILHYACSTNVKNIGNLEIVTALLEHGANPLTKRIIKDSSSTDEKLTALEIAMESEKIDIVAALLKNVFPNDIGEEWYIMFAVKEKRDNPEIVSTLVKYSNHYKGKKVDEGKVDVTKVDVNWRDGFGRTALFYAACSGYKEAVRILLENGADTSLPDNDWRYVKDVVSTPMVRDLIWDHEMKSAHQEDKEDTPVVVSNDNGKKDPNNGKEGADAGKENPNVGKENPKDGVEGRNLSSDADTKPLPLKPGDGKLDPSTCKQTNHDGICTKTYNWEISWCNICYRDISGFVYHCCDCNNDAYLICQDCYENRGRRCPSSTAHTYRKRFFKNGIASYAEFCNWVVDLETPSEVKKIVEDKEKRQGGAESDTVDRVDDTVDRDLIPTPTSPHIISSRRRRRMRSRAVESNLSESEGSGGEAGGRRRGLGRRGTAELS